MFTDKEKERYSRHLILDGFGEESQRRLKNAKVLVVGAGGLGCPALLYLAAAGVGVIGIGDEDVVSLSNLQRQVLYSDHDIGKKKAELAHLKLSSQNPLIKINVIDVRVTKNNVLGIIKDYDLVLDCTDNFSTRYLLNDACVILKKPLVYGAIHKYEGQISVFNFNNGPTYRCLFPEPPDSHEMPGCNEAGVIGVLPGLIGTWQAAEALKIITGIGEPLSGTLISYNLLTNSVVNFDFQAEDKNTKITELGEYELGLVCEFKEINLEAFNSLKTKHFVQLIDVRDENEYTAKNLDGINIPLKDLPLRLHEINPFQKTVVHCKTGVRSKKAIELILAKYSDIEIYNLSHPFGK